MYCSVFRLEEGRAVETQLKTEKILLIVRLKCNECIAADVRSGRSSARIAGSAQVAEYDFAVEKGSSYGSDPSEGRAWDLPPNARMRACVRVLVRQGSGASGGKGGGCVGDARGEARANACRRRRSSVEAPPRPLATAVTDVFATRRDETSADPLTDER